MTFVKQPHLIPEFYLKNFTNSEGNIYVFDKITRKQFSTNPKKVGKEGGFYDIDELHNLNDKQVVERVLFEIESQTAPVIKNVVEKLHANSFKGFSQEERKILSKFIFSQMRRTKRSRTNLKEFNHEITKQIKEKWGNGFIPEEFTEEFDPKDMQLNGLQDDFEEISNIFSDRIWIVWKNNTHQRFYASDHPVIGLNHSDDITFKVKYEICLPLTPLFYLSLLIQNQFPELTSLDNKVFPLTDNENIMFYNSLLIKEAHRQIFSCDNNFQLAVDLIP